MSNPSQSAAWRAIIQLGEKLLVSSAGKYPLPAEITAKRDLIAETAAALLSGTATLWLSRELLPGFTTKPSLGTPADEQAFPARPASPLMNRVLETQQACAGPLSTSPECHTKDSGPQAVAVPLQGQDRSANGGSLLGVLQVERPAGPPFSLEEIELLEGVASQSAIALRVDRQMAMERWRVEQLALVRKVSAQIANLRDLNELARRITHLILHAFGYYYVAIFTLNPRQEILHFRASARPGQTGDERGDDFSPVLAIRLGEGLIGQAALTGQEILANDVSQEPRYRYSDALPETHSEVALPLRVEDRVVGVLDVQSDQLHNFQDIDILVLRALAGNIAVAVESARLYGELRHRAEQLSTVSEVSNAITSILDQEELLEEVVNVIHKRFGYPFVHLFTVHPGRRKIFYEAGSGTRSQIFKAQGLSYDLDDPSGLIPWVARQGETVLANDVDSEPRYRPTALPPDDTRAELTVPLIFGGEVLGVLDIQSDQMNAFGEDDRFLFEALADNIAVAMRNAYLYRSESWRRQVADSLREVAGLLSAEAGLDQVLQAILTELERNLPCDLAAIWLLDEDAIDEDVVMGGGSDEESETFDPDAEWFDADSEDGAEGAAAGRLSAEKVGRSAESEADSGMPLLRLAAAHGPAAGALDPDAGWINGGEDDTIFNPNGPSPATWLEQVLEAGQAVIRQPDSPFEPLGAALGFPPDYSAIVTPLRVGDQNLGVLTLVHHTAGRYGTEARGMTAAFASYAAVAIENARLYEAAHEQAWVSTVLLQVAEATQTVTNLNELLYTVARITPMLTGVKACAVYILDDDEVFVPAAASGLSSEQQVEFERWRFAPGDVPALDLLLEKRHPMILHGDNEDPRLADILFSGPDDGSLLGSELLVLVPMLVRGEVLGAFLIDYSNDQPDNENLAALFDERLAILQGIAHQTAIAVENIHLLKAHKEEAYVSVALLQVAQAVVSMNDLDEILGAVVRITPILVGVKRAVIYLWDAEKRIFRQSQSYGLPRTSESPGYSPAEFPLLEAVRRADSLLAYPLHLDEVTGEPPEAWTTLQPPTPGEIDERLQGARLQGARLQEELLQTEPCLLLAFPLSVKGEVLGVLLVEEPEALLVESLTEGNVNRRLRAKRLEITTGISQQAAMAIQSDRLQRETLERERLEREMQLAREIQLTFLPHQVPELPGWDLNLRWRTAREVGGDFYDFFELPGNRFGLVIADVADKGMPAALFMTLIRTLVRATVQQISSPAEVLQRVNDVLVPDADQGMFVTLVYAVLSLDTGELRYANAGHNPPLLLRHGTWEIERLERCGMALGVSEGSAMKERTIQLAAGDYLILYTDGITDAYSPQGSFFGEEGLQRTILAAAARADEATPEQPASAAEMLDEIEVAVEAFIGDAPVSDDLTLVVLRRKEPEA